MKKLVHMKRMFTAKISQGLFCFKEVKTVFSDTLFELRIGNSRTLKKVKKNRRHPIIPKIPITILNPIRSFPFPKKATKVKAVELTMVAPKKAKNLREVDSAVLSSVSFVRLGKIEAIGTFTKV